MRAFPIVSLCIILTCTSQCAGRRGNFTPVSGRTYRGVALSEYALLVLLRDERTESDESKWHIVYSCKRLGTWLVAVEGVTQWAEIGKWLVGKALGEDASEEFFVISQPGKGEIMTVEGVYTSEPEWRSALESLGIPADLALSPPEKNAVDLTPEQLNPWARESWGPRTLARVGYVILAAGAIMSLLVGFLARTQTKTQPICVVLFGAILGFLSDVFAFETALGWLSVPIFWLFLLYLGRVFRAACSVPRKEKS